MRPRSWDCATGALGITESGTPSSAVAGGNRPSTIAVLIASGDVHGTKRVAGHRPASHRRGASPLSGSHLHPRRFMTRSSPWSFRRKWRSIHGGACERAWAHARVGGGHAGARRARLVCRFMQKNQIHVPQSPRGGLRDVALHRLFRVHFPLDFYAPTSRCGAATSDVCLMLEAWTRSQTLQNTREGKINAKDTGVVILMEMARR